MTGVRLRAEYDLVRDRWFGLQVEAGGLWTPTQSFSQRLPWDAAGLPSYWGYGQAMDLRLGVAGTLSPLPRAPLSPYLVVSVAGVQSWWAGERFARRMDGSVQRVGEAASGFFHGGVGLGIRARLAGRSVQVEYREARNLPVMREFTLGTALRF
jgi:hypothetical protein